MKNLLGCIVLPVLLLSACSTSEPMLSAACPTEGNPDWIAADGNVLACESGAVALAIYRTETRPLAADGQTVLMVAARVGERFPLVGSTVQFYASTGSFFAPVGGDEAAATTNTVQVVTDGNGVATLPLKVDTTPGPMMIRARVLGEDGGPSQAETEVVLTLGVPVVERLALSFSAAVVESGQAVTLTVTGYRDEDYLLKAPGQVVSFCTSPDLDISLDKSLVTLDANGSATVQVVARGQLFVETNVPLMACPKTVDCAKPTAACKTESLRIKPAVTPIKKLALGLEPTQLTAGDTATLTVVGYLDERYAQLAGDGAAIQLCAAGPASLKTTLVTLSGGRASTSLHADAATPAEAPLEISACPYGLDCSAAQLDPRCIRLKHAVAPAPPAIQSMVLSFAESALTEERASELTVAAYSDTARTKGARAGVPVVVCAEPALVQVAPSTLFLDADGRATTLITARTGSAASGKALLMACPYDVACSAPTSACTSLRLDILPKG